MGSIKKSPEKELNMMSTYMLTALLVLLPLTFIPQAESGKPHAHPDSYVKIDDSCVFTGLSCFDGWNNITEVLVGLAEPADCGRQCQNNLPECVWWTMTNPGPLGPTECLLLSSCYASINPLAFTGFNDCPPKAEE